MIRHPKVKEASPVPVGDEATVIPQTVRIFNFAIMVYAGLLPFESIVIGSGGLSRLWGMVVLGSGLIALGHRRPIPPGTFIVLAAAPALALFSYWWSVDQDLTLTRVTTYASLAAVALLAVALGSRATLLSAILGLGLGAAIASMMVIGNYGEQTSSINREIRSTAASANANDLAATLAVAAATGLAMAVHGPNKKARWVIYMPIFLLAGYAVILTASRTATVSLAASGFVVLLWGAKRLMQRVLLAGAAVGGIYYFVAVLDARILDRLLGTGEALEQGDLNYRQVIWSQALEAWTDRPFFGQGAGTFTEVMRALTGQASAAHNSWLSVLVEVGLVGAVLMGVAVFMALVRLRKIEALELRIALTSAGIVLMLNMMLLSWDYRKLPWLFLALVLIPRLQATVPEPLPRDSHQRFERQ